MSEWISVKDRLPDQFVSVLAYAPGLAPLPVVHEAYFAGGLWNSAVIYGVETTDVTHWMPLPEPPEKDKGKAEA